MVGGGVAESNRTEMGSGLMQGDSEEGVWVVRV